MSFTPFQQRLCSGGVVVFAILALASFEHLYLRMIFAFLLVVCALANVIFV